MTKLKRQNEEISISTELWAGIILVIEDYGWKPDGMRISYLANNKQVAGFFFHPPFFSLFTMTWIVPALHLPFTNTDLPLNVFFTFRGL
jgi:hypothetical protein